MRASTCFFAVLCLFPVFISGRTTILSINDSSSNSNVLTGPSNGNPNSTSFPTPSFPSTNASDSTDGSTNFGPGKPPKPSPTKPTHPKPSPTTDPLVHEIIQVILSLDETFYDAAIMLSNDLNNPTTGALLRFSEFIDLNDFNLWNQSEPKCDTFDLTDLLDNNPDDLIASATYLEGFAQMAALALLQNASFSITDTDSESLSTIVLDASAIFTRMGNVSATGTPLTAVPLLTLPDIVSLIRKYKPSCDTPLLLDRLSATKHFNFATPFVKQLGQSVTIDHSGCANPKATAFCQVISSDPTSATKVTPLDDCVIGAHIGPVLLYITEGNTPLPFDPTERVKQQSRMCMGPEFFIIVKDVS